MNIKIEKREDLVTLSRLNMIIAAFQISLNLELYKILGSNSLTLDELAKRSGCYKERLQIVLHFLEKLSLVEKQGELYNNSEISKYYLQGLYNKRLSANIEAVPINIIMDYIKLHKDDMGEQDSIKNKLDGYEDGGIYTAIRLWRELKPKGNKKLLDIGCGSGVFATTFCECDDELSAECIDKIDVLEKLIPKLVDKGLQNRILTRECDIDSLNFADGKKYDYILLSNILHFFNENKIEEILKVCKLSLKKNGMIIINDIFFRKMNIETLFFVFGYMINGVDFVSEEKMIKLLEDLRMTIYKRFSIEKTPSVIIIAYEECLYEFF